VENARVVANRIKQYFQGKLRVIVVADDHGQANTHALIRVAPVDDGVRDQVLIRDQGFHPSRSARTYRPRNSCTQPNFPYRPRMPREADHVQLDGLVDQTSEALTKFARMLQRRARAWRT